MQYPVKKFVDSGLLKSGFNNFILRRPTPLFLSLDVTQRCNARCPWCGFWQTKPSTDMARHEIEKVLEDARHLGCMSAVITGGEPLLRNDISQILQYAKKVGFSTILLTNGYLLAEKMQQIHGNLDVVSVSIDFPDARQNKMRSLNNLFDRAVAGIKLAREYGIAVNINSTITDEHTIEDVENLLNLASSLDSGFSFAPISEVPETSDCEAHIGKLSEEGKKLTINNWIKIRNIADRLLYYKDHEYRKVIQNTTAYLKLIRDRRGFTCYPFSLQVSVAANGDVGGACFLGLYGSSRVGNIHEKSLKEIWHSPRAEQLRSNFKNCTLSAQVGCYLLCIVEFSLLYARSSIILDYMRRII
jgi:MoaA/NifB/PqqE/SkfB family radical SAM enzyme